ncbi:MAG: type II secretion system protein GspD [Planctomycetota bacterium]
MTRLLEGGGLVVVFLTPGCATQPKWEPVPAKVTTKVYDERGQETDGSQRAERYRILGLGPQPAVDPLSQVQDPTKKPAQDPTKKSAQEPGKGPQEGQQRRQREAILRTRFGPTVIINGDIITKRYFLGGEIGAVFLNLLTKPGASIDPLKGPFPTNQLLGGKEGDRESVLGGMLKDHQVSLSYLKDFEPVPSFKVTPVDPAGGRWPQPEVDLAKARKNSLLLVSAKAESLAAFEDALNLFFAYVPQIEIEVKVVEFTTPDFLAFGVGLISTNPDVASSVKNLSSGALVKEITSNFPLTPPFLGTGTGSISNKGVFTLGGVHDGWELDARLEALEAEGKADVLSSPKVVVRNGGTAAILTQTDFPFPKAKISNQTVVTTDIAFKPVGINLGITPVIAGTDSVILQVFADVSAVTGFADTDPVPTPIVSKRQAATSVHVPTGKTTIIGGLLSKSTFENESKIPILGDIPILGYLFRSTSQTDQQTELKFFITPRIIEGSRGVLSDVR